MNISTLLMEQIIQLFLMIFMGYLIVKVGLVKDEDSKVLSKIILYLIIPCVIINAFQVDYTMDTVKGLLTCSGCICHDPGSSPDHYLHIRKAFASE